MLNMQAELVFSRFLSLYAGNAVRRCILFLSWYRYVLSVDLKRSRPN